MYEPCLQYSNNLFNTKHSNFNRLFTEYWPMLQTCRDTVSCAVSMTHLEALTSNQTQGLPVHLVARYVVMTNYSDSPTE